MAYRLNFENNLLRDSYISSYSRDNSLYGKSIRDSYKKWETNLPYSPSKPTSFTIDAPLIN